VALFLMVGGLLWLASLKWAGAASPRTAAFVFGLLGAAGVLLVFRQDLHVAARAVLAVGVATQLARWAGNDPQRLVRTARRLLPALAGLVLLMGVFVAGWDRVHERRTIARAGAAPVGAPNILLLILDTVRARSMSVYGHDEPTTPELQRWVADRGVRFDMALATSSWSLASHASILTGHYPCETGADWETRLDPRLTTLASFLASHGYATGGFVANDRYVSRDTRLSRGFARYEDYRLTSPLEILRHASLGGYLTQKVRRTIKPNNKHSKPASQIHRDVLRWLNRLPEDRPAFVFVNYMDAHYPYLPPEPYNQAFGAPRYRSVPERAWGRFARVWNAPAAAAQSRMHWLERDRRRYHATIAYLDHELGTFFDELDRRGMLDNTLIIVTSDHGEDFYEQGDLQHSDHLYIESVLRVPLLLAWPQRIPQGGAVSTPVSVRQIPATIAQLLAARDHPFPAAPLSAYWSDEQADARENIILAEVTRHPLHGVVEHTRALATDSLHFIRNGDGSHELYNYRLDPWQRDNHAAAEPAAVADFDRLLGRLLATCLAERQLPPRLTRDVLESL
jgi:arylsulfatase A-like enzyme